MPLYPACEAKHLQPVAPKFEELPIWAHVAEIKAALQRSQVICVQGETGCGKSTVLPMLLLDEPGAAVMCTQPRRLAAIALAQRVATQRGEALGDKVRTRLSRPQALPKFPT